MGSEHINSLNIAERTGYILASLVMSAALCCCSSEKPGQMQMAKEKTGRTVPASRQEGGSQKTPLSQSSQRTTARQPEALSKNNLPQVDSVELKTESLDTGDRIRVIAKGSDEGASPVTFTYQWTKNGEPAGEGGSITGFKRDDSLSVKITPYNGKEYGTPKTWTTRIRNTPPKIIEHGEITFDGKIYTYQVRAIDHDGDTLTYELKQAPQGMVIDRSTGLITWKVAEKTSGKFPASAQVSDGHGGESVYNFEVSIGPDTPLKRAR